MSFYRQDALDYHSRGRRGKIAVVPTKPAVTQRDLSLAYSPGVAEPCREIAENPEDVFRYTARGNLVAVVSNGTAVLGLGNIGPLASKPVMEGKGVLFKRFADIDVFDLEVDSTDPDEVIRFCELLEPTVGGINLEDIRSPECFYIEEELQRRLDIPVFHDDQHGTAVISGAALLNALEITGKRIDEVRVVFSGAGASAISTAEHYVRLGVPRENILMSDSHGVVHAGRDDLDASKARFAHKTSHRTLGEAMRGADVFVGLSVGGVVSREMVDALVAGEEMYYPDTLRPALQIIGTSPDVEHVAGLYMMVLEKDLLFFADTTVNIDPDAETLAEIALLSARFVRRLGIEPRVAMLSFSNFGSVRHPEAEKVRRAVELVKSRDPELVVDGEMHADTAVVPEIIARTYPFSRLQGPANVLIFPVLSAANVAYKLLSRLGGAEAIGPILMGMARPVHVLERGSDAVSIVNLTALAVVDAQERDST